MKKKLLSILMIFIGVIIVVYSIVRYRMIYNNFLEHEMKFINGNTDTVLVILFIIGTLLTVTGLIISFKSSLSKKPTSEK